MVDKETGQTTITRGGEDQKGTVTKRAEAKRSGEEKENKKIKKEARKEFSRLLFFNLRFLFSRNTNTERDIRTAEGFPLTQTSGVKL